jgi:hypothetical protein
MCKGGEDFVLMYSMLWLAKGYSLNKSWILKTLYNPHPIAHFKDFCGNSRKLSIIFLKYDSGKTGIAIAIPTLGFIGENNHYVVCTLFITMIKTIICS